MFWINFWNIYRQLINSLVSNIEYYIQEYGFKIIWAIIILLIWAFIAVLVYRFVMYLFKKFKIIDILEKLELEIYEKHEKVTLSEESEERQANLFKKKLKVDHIVSKSMSYYVFLLFFRWSVVILWVTEVEKFLKDVLYYLPSLFVWIIIGYFGIRFANFIYDVVFHTLDLAKQKAAKIIASWAKVIILFFTLMVVLNYTKIVDQFIINTILVWFISMLTLAGWLAFGIWWKDIAKEILESFRK